MIIKILDDKLLASTEELTEALEIAVKRKCKIINLSLGDCVGSKELEKVTKNAADQGIILVASAKPDSVSYPASYSWVIGVTSYGSSKKPLIYYRKHSKYEIEVNWELNFGNLKFLIEPSFACPLITAVVANIIHDNSDYDVYQVREKLSKIAERGEKLKPLYGG